MQEATAKVIPVVKSKAPANFPFQVQTKQTENWNTTFGTVSMPSAVAKAQEIAKTYPDLPIRINHCDGGVQVTDQLPIWKLRNDIKEEPYDVPLWTGKGNPPKVGETVFIRINGIGNGVVTGYCVEGGYLGVMVRVNEENRPQWHKDANPGNPSSLAFGAELKFD